MKATTKKERRKNMDEARASWNTVYQSKEGFECQFTLRDEDETSLAERAKKVMVSITRAGGTPLRRRGYIPEENMAGANQEAQEETKPEKPEKTYIDQKGVRRCNLKLKNGKTCGQPVTEREGRYGPFWSCPNYKEHAA
jgi:hypothetical protein